ncbi:MAG: cellulase family glycosylhydrolase [Candidatus Cohnella colombiensis]|uniref:Cellulase family glycosylhydrolase n=1 Tax=Candidatus Cohnella colombiensis TaxID=3121368 RepID=A0AA95F2G1_9BACL|nr:MAG: cellulase family glycosylhydrolase [Cohnella sp.]
MISIRFRKFMNLSIKSFTMLSLITVALPVHIDAASSKSEMQQMVEAMQPGWNLGNTFDAIGDETAWGNPVTTKELIQYIAASGYKSIRIPITWKQRMGDAPDYEIGDASFKRIEEVVGWALDEGLYVMINLHHDSEWIMKMESNHDAVLDRYKAAWVQIADRFRDYPDKLLFEGINEPRFSQDWNEDKPIYFEMLNELNTNFFNIVRKSGGLNGTRPLVLSTVTGSPAPARLEELAKTITQLNDANLIATIHYYGFYPFSVNMGGATTFNFEAKNDIEQTFNRVYDSFVAKGIPVIVGEYGLLGFDKSLGTIQHGEIIKFFEYMGYYVQSKKMMLMLWDNGQHLDRRELKWSDEQLYQANRASWTGRSSYTDSDSIYVKAGESAVDVLLPLQLNGNTLTEIKLGDKKLAERTDYTLDGSKLTIKASYIQSLLKEEFGVNATLTLSFSAGADWIVNLVHYDTPKLKSVKGSAESFVIPTSFNGDSLATMEATYKSGGVAGPGNWTSYKEYNYSFVPSYEFNVIKLTKDFFKEVQDGEVLLRMHFWSGEVVDYTVTKEGSSIVGVSSQEPESDTEQTSSDDPKSEDSTPVASESPAVEIANVSSPESDNNSKLMLWFGVGVIIAAGLGTGLYMLKKRKDKEL